MDREEMIEDVMAAMDRIHDMGVTFRQYATAAVDALGWRSVSEKPAERSFVVATDGVARWVDARTFSHSWPPTWDGRVATHWHPVHDIPQQPYSTV